MIPNSQLVTPRLLESNTVLNYLQGINRPMLCTSHYLWLRRKQFFLGRLNHQSSLIKFSTWSWSCRTSWLNLVFPSSTKNVHSSIFLSKNKFEHIKIYNTPRHAIRLKIIPQGIISIGIHVTLWESKLHFFHSHVLNSPVQGQKWWRTEKSCHWQR